MVTIEYSLSVGMVKVRNLQRTSERNCGSGCQANSQQKSKYRHTHIFSGHALNLHDVMHHFSLIPRSHSGPGFKASLIKVCDCFRYSGIHRDSGQLQSFKTGLCSTAVQWRASIPQPPLVLNYSHQ